MSVNLDVVPQESVVDSPSDYQPSEVTAVDNSEAPISLDEQETPEPSEETEETTEEPEPEESEPEEIEFDFGGNKLNVKASEVPPEVAEKLDKFSKDIWSDYTKKSQANADTARSLQARATALETMAGLNGEALNAFSQGKGIKAEIEQLSQVDMQALWQDNPDQARQLSDRLSAKQAELQNIIQAVDQYEHQLSTARQAELERLSNEGRQVLDRKYKGFSSEIAPKLEAYAIKSGIPETEAKTWASSPVVAEFAYKAMLYDQMQAAKQPKVTPKPATPVAAMRNKGGSTKPAGNDMSFSELGKLLGIK